MKNSPGRRCERTSLRGVRRVCETCGVRLETTPGEDLRHVTVGLTHDEARTLLANLSHWHEGATLDGAWALVLRDGERELSLTISNHPSDPRFAGRFPAPS